MVKGRPTYDLIWFSCDTIVAISANGVRPIALATNFISCQVPDDELVISVAGYTRDLTCVSEKAGAIVTLLEREQELSDVKLLLKHSYMQQPAIL